MSSKTNPARGMRDFLPADVRKRNYVINIIKEVYESYGFEPLETPAVENLETLMGKYGEEGNQLIFRVLARGEKFEKAFRHLRNRIAHEAGIADVETEVLKLAQSELADLALRYDLTVPLARVVGMHREKLPKLFNRYQIQPVWRADRPSRGRFREFYQCDVDSIGSTSPVLESQQILAVDTVLRRLGFDKFFIRLNHRQILTSMLSVCGIPKRAHVDTLVALDKRDKVGFHGVVDDLIQRKISPKAIRLLLNFVVGTMNLGIEQLRAETEAYRVGKQHLVNASTVEELLHIDSFVKANQHGNKMLLERVGGFLTKDASGIDAVANLKEILSLVSSGGDKTSLRFDITLARGLSYYTGAIMEVDLGKEIGSLGGGGRYDGLIGMFGKEQIPACGFSLGLERILVVMDERGMFPPEIAESTPADVMVTVWSEETINESLKLASELRQSGLRVTVYPEPDKLGKQMKYADSINVPYVCVLGESEIADGTVTVKNMRTGNQETVVREEAADHLN